MRRSRLLPLALVAALAAAACTTTPEASAPPTVGSTVPTVGPPTSRDISATTDSGGPSSSEPTSPGAVVPTIAPPLAAVPLPDLFASPAPAAIERLHALGFAVISYDVCSSSVGQGEVRQVVLADGTELVGSAGVTEAGRAVVPGTTIEVKIGSGAPCS